jgi:hypothetical protein
MQYPGLQVYSPNQHILYIRSHAEPIRWGVKKLKRSWFIPIWIQVVSLIAVWGLFGMVWAFCFYPAQFFCVVVLLILGCMMSFVFSNK